VLERDFKLGFAEDSVLHDFLAFQIFRLQSLNKYFTIFK